MARPKQVSDEEIIGAAQRTMINRGPKLTLAEVGADVGLSAATVVQRFGTKRQLMLGVAHRWSDQTSMSFDGDGDPMTRVVDGLAGLAGMSLVPHHVVNITACLFQDLRDPEFREVIEAGFRKQRSEMSKLLDEAVAQGDVKPCDTAAVARLLQVTSLGAIHSWAIEPVGNLAEWTAECIWATLAPWRVSDDDATTAQR